MMQPTGAATTESSLAGIVVLERADQLAVSVCGTLLAELGATVLQVPGKAHDIGLTERARSKAARFTAAAKMPIAFDITDESEKAQATWRRLVERADIVLIGFETRQDAELLACEKDHRIVCALSAFGVDAPAGAPSAGETVLQATSGLMAATGMPGGAPERSNVPLVEMLTALNAATAILAALRTGGRASLDIAAFDSAIALLTTCISTVMQGRVDGYRLGCGHHLCSPWNVYQAADGWIQLCSTTDEQWRTILRLIERDDLSADPRFERNSARLKNATAVDGVIGKWTAGHSADEAVRIFLKAGLPVGRVRTVSQLVGDPGLAARGMVIAGPTDGPRPGSFLNVGAAPRTVENGTLPADADTVLADLKSASDSDAIKSAAAKPLQGIRAVELGAYTAGPLSGRYLANLGAEVIKIEAAGGEVSRSWQPQFGGHSGYFANTNMGKASVILDLKSGPDRDRLIDLVRTADVLIENLRPGALDKIGLGPGDVLQRVPGLVYCSLSGFGRAAGARPALDTVVQAEAGLMWLVGQGERPQRVGISIADQAAAHAAPLLILAALRAREQTGRGRHIDLSMLDVLAWMIGLAWPDGEPALSPWATLAVADGWLVVSNASRAQDILESAGAVTRQNAVALLTAAGIEAVGVLEMGEVFAHEAVRRRGLVQWVEAEDGTPVPILSSPHRIGAAPFPVGRLPATPGADNERLVGRA
jgi:crotonobetainyl-CoA:carnitine CoA-transferase CaiB-like acyl-CoA transferase